MVPVLAAGTAVAGVVLPELPELEEGTAVAAVVPLEPELLLVVVTLSSSPPQAAKISKKDANQDWKRKLLQLPHRVASSGNLATLLRSLITAGASFLRAL